MPANMESLHPDHLAALEWFENNAGQTFDTRPFDVGLPIKVSSLQRGIWKPSRTPYAVSVVQTHKGMYPDLKPEFFPDGTWMYSYHQEGTSADALLNPKSVYTNRALFDCMKDGIPVGVIIPGPAKSYHVLGLAYITRRDREMFTFEGPVALSSHGTKLRTSGEESSISAILIDFPNGPFDPYADSDDRQTVITRVVRRQGQSLFRQRLIRAYEGKCAMSRYDAEPALEAAHIMSYKGPQTNHPANGLLLRADLHDLFDFGLIAVDTTRKNLQVLLANELAGTSYESLADKSLHLPHSKELYPNIEALDRHREQSLVP